MQQLQQMIAIPATAPGANAVAQVTLNILQSRAVTPDLLAFDNGSFDYVSLVGTTLTVINKGSVAGTTNVWLYYFHSVDRSYGAASITALSPAPFVIRGAGGGSSAGLWGYPTSAALLAQPGPTAAQSQFAYVAEFDATYAWVPGSATAADTVRVIGHTGGVAGRWILDGEKVSLKPIGGLSDDWARVSVVMNAMAYYGDVHFINMGPLIPWRVDTKQTTPNGSNLWLHGAHFASTLTPNAPGGAEDACPFYNSGGTEAGDTTTLAVAMVAGDVSGTFVNAATINVGDRVNLREGIIRRCAREVVAKVGNVLTFDRPILRPYSIGAGIAVLSTCRDIQIHGQRATVTGTGDRVVEFISAWDCLVEDIHADVTMNYFTFGYDVASRDSHFVRCSVDGNGTTPAAFAIEYAEECSIQDGWSFRCSAYNVVFVGNDNCGMRGGYHTRGLALGLILSVNDPTDTLGCRGCYFIGTAFTKNGTHGVSIQDGSSDNVFTDVDSSFNGGIGFFLNPGASGAMPARNIIGGKARGNATAAVYNSGTGKGNRVQGMSLVDNGSAGNVIVCSAGAELDVDDISVSDAVLPNVAGILVASGAAAVIRLGAFQIVSTQNLGAAPCIEIQGGGRVDVTGPGKFTGTASGIAVYVVAGVARIAGMVATGGMGGFLAGAGAFARIADNVDFSATGTPFFVAAGAYNRGQVVLTAAVPVAIAFGDTNATDRCFTSYAVAGGVPTGYINPGAPVVGTGFNVVGLAGDTSTINYEIN